jgi:acyl dehydratase
VPIEAGPLLQFRRALGEPDPTLDPPGTPVPPTFLMVVDHFDPAFTRRPRPGPDGDEHEGVFHVEQRFTFTRPVVVGDELRAQRLPARTWEKQGRRGGRLEFVETVTELRGPDGAVVASAAWVDVRTERSHADLTTSQAAGTATAGTATAGTATAGAPAPPTGPAVAGPSGEPAPADGILLVERLSRTRIVMYVAATGDFHPLHHDDVYARAHGYPGVFAPGMLTMALTARALGDHLGGAPLATLTSRFRAQVWPGDTLVARIEPVAGADGADSPDGPDRPVSVQTLNQHGVVVLETEAVVARGR